MPDGIVHHVQLVHRDEGEPLAVRRRHGVADLPNGELRCVLDLVVERQLRTNADLRSHVERNVDAAQDGSGRASRAAPPAACAVAHVAGTRQILPPYETMIALESGVNE